VTALPGLNHLFQTAKTGSIGPSMPTSKRPSLPVALATVVDWTVAHAVKKVDCRLAPPTGPFPPDLIVAVSLPALGAAKAPPKGFVAVTEGRLTLEGKPYRFAGANLWYGAWLGSPGATGDRARLGRELDRLKTLGVTNLRVLGAGEHSPAKAAVSPTMQEEPGVYDADLLKGLDFLLAEMARRDMKAVIYVNNFWDWSGGMPAYLNWVGNGPWFQQGDAKHPWPEYADYSARFYADTKANALFRRYLTSLVQRTNSVTGQPYRDDPTIMAWQLANEPRPGGTEANADTLLPPYYAWIRETSALIKSLDPRHLVCTGSEGSMGCLRSEACALEAHKPATIDYVTLHVWPNNWSWIDPKNQPATYDAGEARCREYVTRHIALAKSLNKPLVIEEFGLIREARAFIARLGHGRQGPLLPDDLRLGARRHEGRRPDGRDQLLGLERRRPRPARRRLVRPRRQELRRRSAAGGARSVRRLRHRRRDPGGDRRARGGGAGDLGQLRQRLGQSSPPTTGHAQRSPVGHGDLRVAVRERGERPHARDRDDGPAVDAHEAVGVEPAFQVVQGPAYQMGDAAGADRLVVTLAFDPLDILQQDDERLASLGEDEPVSVGDRRISSIRPLGRAGQADKGEEGRQTEDQQDEVGRQLLAHVG
jgi:mannan endo-1,4-beta-mannosidase